MARPSWRGGSSHKEAARKSKRGVRILVRLLQFLLWLIVATWLGRKLFGWLAGSLARPAGQRVPPTSTRAVPLHRDPECGTHVSETISLSLEHEGQVHHFCSAECRDRYASKVRQAASA